MEQAVPKGNNEIKKTFKSQQKVAFLALLTELPNLIAVSVFAALSRSPMLALDALDSISNTTQTFLSFILSKKLQGDESFKYDYGMGKIEAFGSFVSASLLYVGLAAVLVSSAFSIINPGKPESVLLFAILLKTFNVVVDAWLLIKQLRTVKGANSGFVESNVILLKKNLIFDSLTWVTITVSFIFREVPAVVYLDPVMCVGCAVYFAFLNVKIIRRALAELLDKTLDEKTQLRVLKCLSTIWGDIREFKGVRTRRSGHVVYIDLLVSFDGDCSYEKIRSAQKTFDRAVKEILPNGVSAIVIGGNGA